MIILYLSLLGKEAFSLIINNPVRTFVLNKMVDFLLFVGKVVIVVGSGVSSYFAFSGWFPELANQIPTLNYFFTPILFITIGTYFITSSFFSVYAMAVDTIFLSFLQDLKQNDGSPQKPYIMEKGTIYLFITLLFNEYIILQMHIQYVYFNIDNF